jgi:hypothetical protein
MDEKVQGEGIVTAWVALSKTATAVLLLTAR